MKGLIAGRIVHYVLDSERHRAAIVTSYDGNIYGMVNLVVFYDASDPEAVRPDMSFPSATYIKPVLNAPPDFAATPEKATWHWIERD